MTVISDAHLDATLTEEAAPALQVKNLTRTFGGLKAVDSVSLDARAGRVVGLIGPNGAGKTTTINLISGLLQVTAGSIVVDGHDVTTAPAHSIAHLGLARTFQTSRLFVDMTVEQNVRLAALFADRPGSGRECGRMPSLLGGPRQRTRDGVSDILERLDLSALRRTPAKMLSYGHQRRLEIARALALSPKVLLLDEPVAGMNDHEAFVVAALLADLKAEGLAILVVEHNMRFVADTADDLFVLDHGSLIAAGEPGDVLTRPAVIEAYLGSSHVDH